MMYYFGIPSSFSSNAALGALGTEQIFSAASNLHGTWIISASWVTVAAAPNNIALIYGAAAPASLIAQRPIKYEDSAPNLNLFLQITTPFFIPASNGLWRITTVAETGALFTCIFAQLAA